MSRIQPLLFFIIILISNENLFVFASSSNLDTKESDQMALLAIKSKIVDGSGGVFSSWNDSVHFCEWEGVKCGRRHRRVTVLSLSSKSIAGSLSPSVGNLSFLRVLSLSNNTLQGIIPTEIGRLFRLEILVLSNNSFEGNVPAALSNCTNLKSLWLDSNKLVGTILQQVTSLSRLKYLGIHINHFRGEIPPSIGNLTSLERISATRNQFGGNIPDTIGQLKNLRAMGFGINNLSGTIPSSVYNLSLLPIIDFGENQLVGNLPQNIGLMLPKLQLFIINDNKFTGLLPVSFSNCSELQNFEVGNNSFHGTIRINFAMMPNLLIVHLFENNFRSGEHDEMNFIASLTNCSKLQWFSFSENQFKGKLPSCVGNLSTQLSLFNLGDNSIYGPIPPSITNLVNLERLGLFNNQFTGTIPSNLGDLRKLHVLYLSDNSLTGNIPESVGNLSVLEKLFLGNNKLEGTIPTTFQTCKSLNFLEIPFNNLSGSIPGELLGLSSLLDLNLSSNHLCGSLPQEIGKLNNLVQLDLSENELAGEIPSSIGDCSSMEYLYLEGNLFHGLIPLSFSSLRGMQYLDLSRNNFSGEIPTFLEKFSLDYLNLSFNNFEGELPMNGVFANATCISVTGNDRLCGGLSELELPKCIVKEAKKKSHVLIIVIPVACLLVGLTLVLYWLLAACRKRRKPQQPGLAMKQSFLNYSYETLLKATNGFSPESLIGMGSFSRVYKGILEEDGATIAVKVLNLELRGASKSFMAECEAWRNIRHRNLVKIITACSSIDFQGNNFKALVYEFMENGSLESWLHSTSGTQTSGSELHKLSLSQRINIAIDVAHAIDYLHNRGEISIIHCDLKPSNILLDNDMVAHVGDFGLARFFLPDVSSTGQSSSIGLRGTIGYAPPEYGLGSEMSTYGDVYSFGIILLEIMTGKRPTDNMFINGLNIHNYARTDCITDIADPVLVEQVRNETLNPTNVKQREECIISVVKIGIACSVNTIQDRMNISDVVDELQRIANIILQHEITVTR